MVKYLLVCKSSCSTNHVFLNIGTTSAIFNALGKVHVSMHLSIKHDVGMKPSTRTINNYY